MSAEEQEIKEPEESESGLTITDASLISPDPNKEVRDFRKKMETFAKLVNTAPVPEKIKTHQGYDYLPISTVEKELDRVYFGLVQYECISYQQIFNEVACHARIKVFHPVINQWMNYDGLGSAVLQQDKDTKVADFMHHKKANAGQLTYPKAYAEAIKNAAKKIGKRFGADINRKFEDEYVPFYKDEPKKDVPEEKEPEPIEPESPKVEISEELIHSVTITDDISHLTTIWNENQELQSNPNFIKLLNARKVAIRAQQ